MQNVHCFLLKINSCLWKRLDKESQTSILKCIWSKSKALEHILMNETIFKLFYNIYIFYFLESVAFKEEYVGKMKTRSLYN